LLLGLQDLLEVLIRFSLQVSLALKQFLRDEGLRSSRWLTGQLLHDLLGSAPEHLAKVPHGSLGVPHDLLIGCAEACRIGPLVHHLHEGIAMARKCLPRLDLNEALRT